MRGLKKAGAAVALAFAATVGPVTCSDMRAPAASIPPPAKQRSFDLADLGLLGIGIAGLVVGWRGSRSRRRSTARTG